MKKYFMAFAIFTLIFTACEQPTNGNDMPSTPKLPKLTIRNESSYDLTNVKFSNITFATSGNDLPISSQSVKQLTANDINKVGYITFTRKDIGIDCRTEAISIGNKDFTFTFGDNKIVMELANNNNSDTLAQISFLSKVIVERGGLTVAKNETENIGDTVINYLKQTEFNLKNTGDGKLLLTGTEPIKINDAEGVFSIVQPASSEILPNGSLIFKINFLPQNVQTYIGTVTISSNDKDGVFSFIVIANGTAPKPVAGIVYNNNNISQDGTIDAGETILTISKNITVTIKNTGTLPLEIETDNITITGPEASSFTKTTNPGSNISINSQSSFIIECNPVKLGENNATLLIPTNDDSRNPVIVYLKVTVMQGHSVLELSQGNTVITDNSIIPFDFGQVDVQAIKNFTFTIKNTGNIPLELSGNPMVVSSNANFTIFSQPLNNTISPGSTTTFVIQYEPKSEIIDTGFITISNSSDSMVFTMNVKGTGYVKRPQITIRQGNTTINQYSEFNSFGTVAIGESKDIAFTIGNSGDANLTFVTLNNNRINLGENSAGFFSVIQPSSEIIAPGSTTAFTVRFSPTTVGENFTAKVLIETNSRTNDNFSFTVKANSYEKKPQITLKKDNANIVQNGEYDFGTMSLASGNSIDITFTIGNSGEANLVIDTVNNNRINLADNTAEHFTVISQPTSSTAVSPGNTATFTIRFKPKSAGTNFYAVIHIKTNSQTNNEFSFRIKGTGVRYMIGDTGTGGGIVFNIQGNQVKEFYELSGAYTWSQAKTAAQNYRGGGFSNWYLPTSTELVLISFDCYRDGFSLLFGRNDYWSSTEYDSTRANMVSLYNSGIYLDMPKSNGYGVLAVRSFTF